MIGFMPAIYPDELVYSWFCRYYVHSGYAANKMALNNLLFNRHCNPSKEFIGHLAPGMEYQIRQMYPFRKLVMDHTMFPQYARFIGLTQKKNAIYHLEHDFCDAHRLFAILPRSERDQWLRYCPLCIAEDRELYGEAYWHRKHQIRNMDICARHKCRLADSKVSAKSDHIFILEPAETAVQDMPVEYVMDPFVLGFAAYMDEIFSHPVDMESDIPVSAILYFGMEGTKYMSGTGRTRNTKLLADDMQEFFAKNGLEDIASYYQVQKTLLGNRYDFNVVCQTAFFLGMPVEKLVSPRLSEGQLSKERDARCPKKEDRPTDWKQYDREMLPVLEQVAHNLYHGIYNPMGRPEKITERLINRYAGLPAHRIENMPLCKEALQKYEESYGENWARRIVWAYGELMAESGGNSIFWTDIRKLAGVKKKNFPKALPYLDRFTDKATADRIRGLV